MDFIAVDFETPNCRNDSICSIGLTLVKNSSVVYSREIRVNPHANFDLQNITVHGITKQDVSSCPDFSSVWQEIGGLFSHYPIVMHNAPFDCSVLSKAAKRAKVALPRMDFYCTMELCRENYGFTDVSLPSLCAFFSFPLVHHNPVSDSLCTARIMLHLIKDENTAIHTRYSAQEFSEKDSYWNRPKDPPRSTVTSVYLDFDSASGGVCRSSAPSSYGSSSGAESIISSPECSYFTGEIVFPEKRFVFTGAIPGLDRSVACQFVEAKGGRVTSSVSKKTNYVVVGLEDLSVVGADGKSTKIEKAEELISQGHDVHLVSYEHFLKFYQS